MTIQLPIPDYAAARQAMVDSQLRPQGVNDPAVIEAMSLVPREMFVAEDAKPLAYADRAVPMGDGRLLSAPATLGLVLTAMAPTAGERALVIGGGTGYSAAVLGQMGVEVIALESSPALVAVAKRAGVSVIEGELEQGHKRGGPYDLLLIDGAVEYLPDTLVAQLRDGGRLGAALIDRGITRLVIGRKAGDAIGVHTISDAGVAALPGFRRPQAFTF